jgi:hypothetical protein
MEKLPPQKVTGCATTAALNPVRRAAKPNAFLKMFLILLFSLFGFG